jgi:hypothetical protein
MQPVIAAVSKVKAEVRDKTTDDFPSAKPSPIVVILRRLVTPETRALVASAVSFLRGCDRPDTSAPRLLVQSDGQEHLESTATPRRQRDPPAHLAPRERFHAQFTKAM